MSYKCERQIRALCPLLTSDREEDTQQQTERGGQEEQTEANHLHANLNQTLTCPEANLTGR